MASTTPVRESQHTVALDLIDVPDNVRELDAEHVHALAGSIALQGMLVPIVVRPAGEQFELVAGFHRLAAACELGLAEIPAVVRDGDSAPSDRAVENSSARTPAAASGYLQQSRLTRSGYPTLLLRNESSREPAPGWPPGQTRATVPRREIAEGRPTLLH